MKTHPINHRRGIALVVVLIFLVLLSVFIVGFFSNSQDELTAAQSFTGEVSASHLAESAVSVVMGQIREATGRTNGAWGSQPGMIRVYRDGDSASSKADAFFKLYSSDDMIVSGSEIANFDPANEVAEGPGTGWEHVPALWTNLNEKVTVPVPGVGGTVSSVDRYPILDPILDGQVEGLELPPLDFVPSTSLETTSKLQKARMPVKWLYVLKDGTLTAPSSTGGNGTQAIWKKGEREPTSANPIVGRVAFWTDDECCKVNVNTAGGYTLKHEDTSGDGGMPTTDDRGNLIGEDDYAGSFWDTPRALTVFDQGQIDKGGTLTALYGQSDGTLDRGGLALSQPVRGEFQRYPGHPSTTSLGIIFRGKRANNTQSMQDSPYLLKSGQIALLAPRLIFSLTKGSSEQASNYGTTRLLAAFDQPPGLRVKRLYASVDEVFYAQPNVNPPTDRKQSDWEIGVLGVNQNDDTKVLTADYLEKMRFFLTAHSRAPEVNLFGQPRVTIWPVYRVTGQGKSATDQEADRWNASDRLIAFCSTIGPDATKVDEQNIYRYIFQRYDAYSPSNDLNILRNAAVMRYLRNLTSKPFPGFGGVSFQDKYKAAAFGGDTYGREQILIEMFDYIRTVNLRDSTRDKDFDLKYLPVGGVTNVQQKEKYKYAPRGLVVPAVSIANGTDDNARHGFGRFPTISEASIVLYVTGYIGGDKPTPKRYLNSRLLNPTSPNSQRVVLDNVTDQPVPIDPAKNRNDPANQVKVTDTLVRAFFLTETFNPMQGYAPTISPSTNSVEKRAIIFEIENLDQFNLIVDKVAKNLAFPSKSKSGDVVTNEVAYSSGNLWGGRNSGGSEGFMHTMWTWPDGRPKAGVWPAKLGLGGAKWYPYQSNPNGSYAVPSDPSKTLADASGLTGISGVPISYETAPGSGVVRKTVTLQGPQELKIRMYYGNVDAQHLIRDIDLKGDGGFGISADIPIPTDRVWSGAPDPATVGKVLARTTASIAPFTGYAMNHAGGFVQDPAQPALWSCNMNFQFYSTGPSFLPRDRSAKSLGDWLDPQDPNKAKLIKPGRLTWIQNDSGNHMGDVTPGADYERKWQQILQPGDVVRSVLYGNPATGKGDLRLSCVAVNTADASSVFVRHPDYRENYVYYDPTSTDPILKTDPKLTPNSAPIMHAQTLRMSDTSVYYPDRIFDPAQPTYVSSAAETRFGNVARLASNTFYPAAQAADLPPGFNGVKRFDSKTLNDNKVGDFDTGMGSLPDGPFCNKADEGNLAFRIRNNKTDGSFDHWTYPIPYFTWAYEETFETFFSPNRQAPSPVVFGSLLSGKATDWQTLCFCPNPAGANHPGLTDPKDYLWLDLFNMPVVEPYAISEPFSTAGKINLNYPIVPFTHIKRSTGLRAALQPVRVTAIPVGDVATFKTGTGADKYGQATPKAGVNYRYIVDRDETIKGFDAWFAQYSTDHSKGFLKVGAQICEFYLYPRRGGKAVPSATWTTGDAAIKSWWSSSNLTGDNVREKPYADLYPRICTKSNTYCVHVRAQALRQSAASDSSTADTHYLTWDEKRDRVIGEYRGSSIIERYIDPQDERFDTTIPTKDVPKINPDARTIDDAYRFRVLSTKRFDP